MKNRKWLKLNDLEKMGSERLLATYTRRRVEWKYKTVKVNSKRLGNQIKSVHGCAHTSRKVFNRRGNYQWITTVCVVGGRLLLMDTKEQAKTVMELGRKGIKYNPLKQINKRANLTACLWNSKLEHALSTKIFRWCKRRHCKEACLCCVKLPRLQSLLKHDEKFFSIKMETRDKSKQGCVGLEFVMMIYLKGMMCAVMLLCYMDVDKQSRASRKREKSPIKYIGRKVKFCEVMKEWWAQQLHELLVSTFRGKKVPREGPL